MKTRRFSAATVLVLVLALGGARAVQAQGGAGGEGGKGGKGGQPSVADAAREQEAMTRALQQLRERAKANTLDELARAGQKLAALRFDAAAFEERLAELLQNSDGKRLAADKATVAAIHHQGLMRPVVPLAEIDARAAEAEAAHTRLTQSSPATVEDTLAAVRDIPFQIRGWAALRAAELAERTRWFDAAALRLQAVPVVAGAPTLAKTLDAYSIEFDKWSSELFAQGMQAGKEEKEEEVVERGRLLALLAMERKLQLMEEKARVELESEQARHQAEMERQLDEIAALKRQNELLAADREIQNQESEAERKEREERARQIQLEARCKEPDVQSALAPFITPGYWNIGKGGRTYVGVAEAPMSLNGLRTLGVFRPGNEGHLALVRIASDKNNDRPKWGLAFRGDRTFLDAKPEQKRMVADAQEYLKELGPTLVKLKMLSE